MMPQDWFAPRAAGLEVEAILCCRPHAAREGGDRPHQALAPAFAQGLAVQPHLVRRDGGEAGDAPREGGPVDLAAREEPDDDLLVLAADPADARFGRE